MTEPTEEARAELGVIRGAFNPNYITDTEAKNIMLALDRHHGRTPPDPMVAKADRLLSTWSNDVLGYWINDPAFERFVAALKKEFPDG